MIICLSGIHGNEPAGVKALDLIFKMIEVEPITNPKFHFSGSLIGLIGNIPALEMRKRFIHKDLNRLWTEENIHRIEKTPANQLNISEERELKNLLKCIKQEIRAIKPEKVIFMDLHTTTAHGGIFSIVDEDPNSRAIAKELHAPVVTGMDAGLKGTTKELFELIGKKVDTTGLVFESGQHKDPLSVNRAIAALTNCLRIVGCIPPDAVENVHDQLLTEFSKKLPKVVKLEYCHKIKPSDKFDMLPGYMNFQRVSKGEILAKDKSGPIRALKNGYILMPLYQKQGEDGFFIVSRSKELN